jgi:hypothetical protein
VAGRKLLPDSHAKCGGRNLRLHLNWYKQRNHANGNGPTYSDRWHVRRIGLANQRNDRCGRIEEFFGAGNRVSGVPRASESVVHGGARRDMPTDSEPGHGIDERLGKFNPSGHSQFETCDDSL